MHVLKRRLVGSAALLLFYLVLVVWLSWPLASHLATHLPYTGRCCRFDRLHAVWALAWQSHALITDPTRFTEANIYFPARHALFYGPTSFGALLYFFVPFLLTGNPILAMNVTFLVSVALAAWTLHLVVARWTGSLRAGFLAAWTLLTTYWTIWGFPSTSQGYAVTQYFPLIIFMAAAPASRLNVGALLALLVLQGLTSIYTAVAVLGPFAVVAFGRLVGEPDRRAGLRLVGVLAGATVMLFAAYSGHVLIRVENPLLGAQTYWGGLPTDPNPVLPIGLGLLLTPPAATAVPIAALLVVTLGAVSRCWGRGTSKPSIPAAAWLHGTAWAATGMFLSQRPVLDGPGTRLAWPLVTFAHWVPLYEVIRSPQRLGVAGLMGLAILAGIGVAEVAARWPWTSRTGRRVLDGLLVAIAVAMYHGFPPFPSPYLPPHLNSPYPLTDETPTKTSFIPVLQRATGPVVELPAAPNPWLHSEAMYRSIFHGKPLLNGYGSFWPAGFAERMALADRLPDPDALSELRRTTGLAMILVRTGSLGGPKRELWLELATRGRQPGLRLVARDNHDLVFAVEDVR